MNCLGVYAEFWLANGNMLSVYKMYNGYSGKQEYFVSLFDIDKLEDETLFASGDKGKAFEFYDSFVACHS